MAIRRYEDLVCWQRANELKNRVYELLANSPAKSDVKFCDQLTSAVSSGAANLAEAFGQYEHGDAARFARYAKASLNETHNHLRDGVDRKFWTEEAARPLLALASSAIRSTAGWIRYLTTSTAPRPRPKQ